MLVGIVKEVKDHEYRVGATPAMVQALSDVGAQVVVEEGAGAAIGFLDAHYRQAGAKIVSLEEAWEAELIIKVKEPQLFEIERMHEGQVLYAFLHLAADKKQAEALAEKKVLAIAYETITDTGGHLPLLAPMSAIAGRISAQMGSVGLHMRFGGAGRLMGGIAGSRPANVVVIGAGVSGTHALQTAMGMGARVTVLDTNLKRLEKLQTRYGAQIKTLYSTSASIEESVLQADLVILAVLIAGDRAPLLIKRDLVHAMKKGSVIADIAIDQGGACATSRPTTHSEPFYVEEEVVHYCVTNMPGACAATSTEALTNATMAHALSLVTKGPLQALAEDTHLRQGVNVYQGKVTHRAIAQALEMEYADIVKLLY